MTLRRIAVAFSLAAAFALSPTIVHTSDGSAIQVGLRAASAQSLFPLGNVETVGDSKIRGVTDIPGSCGPRDPMYATVKSLGGTFVGTLSGGDDGTGAVLTPCPISGVAIAHDGHSGFHAVDITNSAASWFATIAGTPPNVIIVHVATNDMIAQVEGAQGWNMDKFYVDYDAMMRTLLPLAPAKTWIAANMDPMPSLIGWPAFYQANDYIGQEVKKYQRQGYRIFLSNDFSNCGMGAAGDYNSGGIHELPQGYVKKGTCFLHTMQTLQP